MKIKPLLPQGSVRSQEEVAFFLLHPGQANLLGKSSSSSQSGATHRRKLSSPLQTSKLASCFPPSLICWERVFPLNEEGGTVADISVTTSKLPFGVGVITPQSPGKPCTGEQQHQSEAPCRETTLGLQGDGDGALKLPCVSPRTQRSLKDRVLITLNYPILDIHMEENTETL